MEKLGQIYNGVVACFGAIIGFLFGGVSGLLITFIAFVVFDFVTGVLCGIVEKNLSSEIAFKGFVRKVFELLVVSAAHLLDYYVFKQGSVIFTSVCFIFISTEGISLIENASRLGVPIPQVIVNTLSQLKVKAGGLLEDTTVTSEKEEVLSESPSSAGDEEDEVKKE